MRVARLFAMLGHLSVWMVLLALLWMSLALLKAEVPEDPQVWLRWSPVTHFDNGQPITPDITVGYVVYWDTDGPGAPYTNRLEVGPDVTSIFVNLECRPHWFAVKATLDGQESEEFSGEVNRWPSVRPGSDPLAKGPGCWIGFGVPQVQNLTSDDVVTAGGSGD